MDNLWLNLALRWLHILPAVALGGGLFFLCMIWTAERGTNPFGANWESIRPRWARLVAVCSGLLLVTGLANGARNIIDYELPRSYDGMVLVKLVLGLAVFAYAALLTGRTRLAVRMQTRSQYWLTVAAMLVIALVLLGGWMKFVDRVPKVSADPVSDTRK